MSRKIGFYVSAQFLNRVIIVALAALMARVLTVEDFAAFSYLRLTVEMLAGYAGLGLYSTTAKSLATLHDRPDAARDEYAVSWFISCIAGFIAIIVLFSVGGLISNNDVPIWWYSLFVFSIVVGIVPSGAVVGLELFRANFAVIVLSATGMSVVAVVAYFEASLGWAIMSLFVFYAMRTVGNTTLTIFYAGCPFVPSDRVRLRSALNSTIETMGPLALTTLFTASGAWALGWLIKKQAGSEEFAVYAIGLQWYGIAVFFSGAVSRALLPRRTRESAAGNFDVHAFYKTSTLFFGGALALATIGWFLRDILISIYGSNYTTMAWIIPGFMIAGCGTTAANMSGISLLSAGRQPLQLLSVIVWFFCLLVIYSVLPSPAVSSACIALGIAGLIQLFVSGFFVSRIRLRGKE